MSFALLLCLAEASSLLGMRLRGRHALFPPRGEQEKQVRELERHSRRRLAPAGRSPIGRRAKRDYGTRTTLPTLRRSVIMLCAAPASSKLKSPATTGVIVP